MNVDLEPGHFSFEEVEYEPISFFLQGIGQSKSSESTNRIPREIVRRTGSIIGSEWDRHRALITELYSHMRLTDVQHQMEVRCGFKAR